MAVSRMKQISIIGRMDSLDQVVRVCGGSGVMQPDDAITFFSDPSGFEPVREDDPYTEPIARLQEAASRVGGTLSRRIPPRGRNRMRSCSAMRRNFPPGQPSCRGGWLTCPRSTSPREGTSSSSVIFSDWISTWTRCWPAGTSRCVSDVCPTRALKG